MAIKALTELGYQRRIPVEEASEPVLAQISPARGGDERYCNILNKKAAQRRSKVTKGFAESYNSFFLFYRKLLLVCFVVRLGTLDSVSQGSIENMVGQCIVTN